MEELISIIVPVYNVEKYLHRCVDSIIGQTYMNLEIILVDDGSTDSSGEICDEYEKKDSRINVIHKENGGLSSARNIALDKANGMFIGFVDSDDYIALDMYEELYRGMKYNEADIACCGRYNVYENLRTDEFFVLKEPVVMTKNDAIGRVLMWDGMDSSACDKLYRRHIWDDIRFPVGKINEDIAIIFSILEKSKKIIHIGVPKYYYAHRQNSITTDGFSKKNLDLLTISNLIYNELTPKYPELSQQINYFYLHNISYLYSRIVNTHAVKLFYKEYQNLHKILKTHVGEYILNKFSIREKVKMIFIVYFPILYKIVSIKNKMKEGGV